MSDFTEKHPHNALKYNLPNSTCYKKGMIHYRIEHLQGMFPKWIALIQYELNGARCTGVLYTEAYMFCDGESYLWINTTPIFDNIHKEFPKGLPQKIKSRFPHLAKMVDALTDYTDLKLNYGLKAIFGIQSYRTVTFFKLAVKEPSSYLMDKATAQAVEALFSFVINAEKEYNQYKKSKLFKIVSENYKKAQKAAFPATTLYVLYKIARLGYSLYTGVSSNDSDFGPLDSFNDGDNGYFDVDSSSDYMVDYLCGDENSSYSNEQGMNNISFTGNGDKYTDNSYNQAQADKWLAKQQDCLAKGDISGADAAKALAKDHLRRIK